MGTGELSVGDRLATGTVVRSDIGTRLGRLVILPFVTIGVVSALMVWQIEHVGSIALSLVLAVVGVTVGVLVAQRVRAQIDDLSGHYEVLLRRAEDESRRAEAAARIRDEFLSTLSHELRTPLNSVLGWSRLLSSGKLDPAQGARAIQAIERAGLAQSRLIEDLLDVSRIVSGRLQLTTRPTHLQPIVGEVLQALEPAAAAKGLLLQSDLDREVEAVTADPDRIRQVAWHLVSNAIKFTPSEGVVQVVLRRVADDVSLVVRDSGIGFAPDVTPLLFERLRQGDSSTTRPFGGIGVGLGIVRHLVEMHGGTVSAHSAGPDRGATFEVRLPGARPGSTSPDVPEVAHPPLLQGISVLVVDDDRASLEFARSTLEQYGAVVETAVSAEEARQHFLRAPPDVLLSDLRMPGTDGLQLIREIRAIDSVRGRTTPAAAFSALARSSDREAALAAGYQIHVTKPIDPAELAVTVGQLVKDE